MFTFKILQGTLASQKDPSTLAVTLMTVSYQSLKAATMNPVKSLRSE
jgi:hypothetical protein